MRSSRFFVLLLLLAVVPLVLTGCGGSKKKAATTTTAAPTTTQPKATTTTTPPKTEPTGSVDQSATPVWQRNATSYRGQNGATFKIDCTPNGEASSVWGTNLYTDDSSICTAAVQVGLITFKDGGTVTYKIEPGADVYTASDHNGVQSKDYPQWGGSFSFPDAKQIEVAGIPWDRTGGFYKETGTITVTCSPNGQAASIWGTGTYTDDSSICTAAVHSGLITLKDGGQVRFKLAGGQSSYKGTTAHGITSQSYGAWGGSFVFVTS